MASVSYVSRIRRNKKKCSAKFSLVQMMAKLLAVMEKYGICILSFRVLLHKMPPVETSEKDCMKSDQSVHLAHYIS